MVIPNVLPWVLGNRELRTTPAIAILLVVGLPLVAPFPLAVLGRRLGRRTAWLALGIPLVGFLALSWLFATQEGSTRMVEWSWVPSYWAQSVVRDRRPFAVLCGHRQRHGGVGGVLRGVLSRRPLCPPRAVYAYLMLFMAAMLGTVLSDNLLLLFFFWNSRELRRSFSLVFY